MNESKCEEPIDLTAEFKVVEEPTAEEKALPLLRNGKLRYEGAACKVATDILSFLSQFDCNCHVELKFNFGE